MELAKFASDLAYKRRKRRPPRVRTPEGVRKYGQSIGTVIRRDLIERARAIAYAAAPKKTRKKKEPPATEGGGWANDWRESDTRYVLHDGKHVGDFKRVHEEGLVVTVMPVGKKWRWQIRNNFGKDWHPYGEGFATSPEKAKQAAEEAIPKVVADPSRPKKFAQMNALSSMYPGKPFKAVSDNQIGQDFGSHYLAIEFLPRYGNYQSVIIDKATGDRFTLADHAYGEQEIRKADDLLNKVRELLGTRPDFLQNLKRRKNHENWEQYSWGIRGVHWYEDGDWEPSTTQLRRDLANKDSKDIGIEVVPEFPVECHELLNAVMWSYETMYPGFSKLFRPFTYNPDDKYYNKEKGPPLAWNMNWGATNGKGVDCTVNFLPQHWDNKSKLALHEVSGEGHFHTSRAEARPEGYEEWEHYFIDTLHHELGHTVHAALFTDHARLQEVMKELRQLGIVSGVKDEQYGTQWLELGRINTFAARLLVSGYAGTNVLELLAEIWTEYVSDPHPREGIAKIGALMEKSLTAYIAKLERRERANQWN